MQPPALTIGEAEKLFVKGQSALQRGRTLPALACFEKALELTDTPLYRSYLAYCIAKERGQLKKAVSLCEEAIESEPRNPVHYLNLGRIYLHAKKKEEAVSIFREGLKHEMHEEIIDELQRLVSRKPPVFPFLKRENPINKYIGLVLSTLRLR
ncbi:MAG: tetratricopeptide repeat protein [Nitrospirota bacterium]